MWTLTPTPTPTLTLTPTPTPTPGVVHKLFWTSSRRAKKLKCYLLHFLFGTLRVNFLRFKCQQSANRPILIKPVTFANFDLNNLIILAPKYMWFTDGKKKCQTLYTSTLKHLLNNDIQTIYERHILKNSTGVQSHALCKAMSPYPICIKYNKTL